MIPAPDSAPGSPLQARSRLLSASDWIGAARHREPSLRFERHDHHHPAPASPRTAATPTMFGDGNTDYPGMKPQISYHGRVLEPDKPAGQALPTRSPRSAPSSSDPRAHSSPAATFWWTAG